MKFPVALNHGAKWQNPKALSGDVNRYMHSLFDPDLTRMSDSVKAMYQSAQQRAQISLAGEKLQHMRVQAKNRPARLYTGYIGRHRAWFGQPVVLPGNILGKIVSVYRGLAAVAWEDPFAVQGNRVTSFEIQTIRLYKNPAAVALGRLKHGRKERKSEVKAQVARRNGAYAVRPGRRPRGRPPKRSIPKDQAGIEPNQTPEPEPMR